jgi:Cu2+-exporting ATPase/Cu+-exporting ATPase
MNTFHIRGMHCASCAGIIEKTLKNIDGVTSADVNYGTETATIAFDARTTIDALSKALTPLGYSLEGNEDTHHGNHDQNGEVSRQRKEEELRAMRRSVLSVLPLAVISIGIMAWDAMIAVNSISPMPLLWETFFHHLLPIFATYTLVVTGKPYLLGLGRFFRYGKANMDTLIGLGTVAAFGYSFCVSAFEVVLAPYVNVEQTYYDVTIVVIAFITFGKYLEMRSKMKTGNAIAALMKLQSNTAHVIRDGKEYEIPIDQVVQGDIVLVKPAGRIPVDGVVLEGSSYVDESVVTGESMPVKKHSGDTLISGSMNTDGSLTFRATNVGAATMLARMIAMVEHAQASRAPIQSLADRISSIFVPVVLVIAFLSLGAWILFGTVAFGFSQALSYGLVSFVGVLVIACPCALGLATPTAMIVGVGKGAAAGILVKDAATLETLHRVTTVVFDKTGTLTKGTPSVIAIEPVGNVTDDDIARIVASLESHSEHPLATAVCAEAKRRELALLPVQDFRAKKGFGIEGVVNGTAYVAGNVAWMDSLGISIDRAMIDRHTKEGKTPIILASGTSLPLEKGEIVGMLWIADAVKDDAAHIVQELHRKGLRVMMMSGDMKRTAEYIGNAVGVDEVFGEVLPEQKVAMIRSLQEKGLIVAMVGDGVNDAPALAQANVGIAMATGTDVAIESAGMTLLHGDLKKLPRAFALSHMTMRGIRQNLFWAFAYNIIGIPLAAGVFFPFTGWLLSPIFAGAAMAFSSVSVVMNSLRIQSKSF